MASSNDAMADFLADVGTAASKQGAKEYKEGVGRTARIIRRLKNLLDADPKHVLVDAVEVLAQVKTADEDGVAAVFRALLSLTDEDTIKAGAMKAIRSLGAQTDNSQASSQNARRVFALHANGVREEILDADTARAWQARGYNSSLDSDGYIVLTAPQGLVGGSSSGSRTDRYSNMDEEVEVFGPKRIGKGLEYKRKVKVSKGLTDGLHAKTSGDRVTQFVEA